MNNGKARTMYIQYKPARGWALTPEVPEIRRSVLTGGSPYKNPYATFLRVVRVWRVLVLHMRLGQAFGIDRVLTHRPPGNLIVYCPVCPELGVNVGMGQPKTPTHLR